MSLNKDDKNLLKELGFSKNDNNHISLEFKNILIDDCEQYLDYTKTEEESVIERLLNK